MKRESWRAMDSFNVLVDPWIPLDSSGRVELASYVDVMTGARDAADLLHPRDDCRFFARLLLSALTQALFTPGDASELRARIETPMARDDMLARVDEVRGDFELLAGVEPWMQSPVDGAAADANETRNLLLDQAKHLLFRPGAPPDALCVPCAVPIVYGLQAFVPKGGRGYSPGVRGAPPTTTLVLVPQSIRRTAWANTLTTHSATRVGYGKEPARPWRCGADSKDGDAIGLVEGLFWKPRALRLRPAPSRTCAACGASVTHAFMATAFGPRQQRTGGQYRHPATPCRRVQKTKTTTELRFQKLDGERPAWTSLVDWLVAGDGDVLPAPVVDQWTEDLAESCAAPSLLVLDYGTKDASVVHRVVEAFPLSLRITHRDVADAVQARIDEAETALNALRRACVRLHMKARPSARLSKSQSTRERREKDRVYEAAAAFWQRTEPPFFRVHEAAVAGDANAEIAATDAFRASLRKTALALFDAYAAPSLLDSSRIALVAEARSWLRRSAVPIARPELAGDEPVAPGPS